MTRILTSADVENLLSGPEARDELSAALAGTHTCISTGRVLQPVPYPLADPALDPAVRSAVVPMLAHDLESGMFVVKALADSPGNRAKGLPAQRSTVAVFDGFTGECIGLIDGKALTRIRTAAVTALATDRLARQLPRVLALVGAGSLAVEHAVALSRVRQFERVVLWSRSAQRAEDAAKEIRALLAEMASAGAIASASGGAKGAQRSGSLGTAAEIHIPRVHAVASAEEAVRAGDVVCTLTPSEEPYVRAKWLRPGALLNAVGSPPRRYFAEIQAAVFERSAITVVDTHAVAMSESGAVRSALAAGFLQPGDLRELGDVLSTGGGFACEDHSLRVFVSVGVGAQDLAAAQVVLHRAKTEEVGTQISLR